jgi:hypothetical protein
VENPDANIATLCTAIPAPVVVGLNLDNKGYKYSLTPWCRIFFEKLIVTQLVIQ